MNLLKRSALAVCLFAVSIKGIAEIKEVSLSSVDYPPYYSQALADGGPFTEIIVAAFKASGYEAKVKFMPWKRAYKWTEEGKFDGLYTAWFREDRTKTFAFSEPLPANELVFFKNKSLEIDYKNFTDLKNKKIGVVRGYSNPPGFDEAGLTLQEVNTDKQNLKKLAKGYIDLALVDKALAKYIIRKEMPGYSAKLDWLEPPVEIAKQYLMFSRKADNYEEKLKAFNEGYAKIQESGEMEKILEKHRY